MIDFKVIGRRLLCGLVAVKDSLVLSVLIGVLGWLASQWAIQHNEFKNDRIRRQIEVYSELLEAAAEYTALAYPPLHTPDEFARIDRNRGNIQAALQKHEILYWSKHAYMLAEPFEGCFTALRHRMLSTFLTNMSDLADAADQQSGENLIQGTDTFIAQRNNLHILLGNAGRALRDYHEGYQGFIMGRYDSSGARYSRCE